MLGCNKGLDVALITWDIELCLSHLGQWSMVEGRRCRHALHLDLAMGARKAVERARRLRVLPLLSDCVCEVCGEAATAAHHDDYSKPLDVRYLCAAHHTDWHRALSSTPQLV
jgi:hypothetical protein